MPEKKIYEEPKFEVVEPDEGNGANTRLPYGIAKGLGLSTDGMTPRQVWEMLKKRGVNPENEYEKLKEKATEEIENEPVKEVDAQRKVAESRVYDSKAYKALSSEAKNKLKVGLGKLSEDNFKIFSDYMEKLNGFVDGSGLYRPRSKTVEYSQKISGDALDKELGFDFDATTFFHEYGHFVDNVLGEDKSYLTGYKGKIIYGQYGSLDVDVDEDTIFCLNEIIKASGSKERINNINRITRDQKTAFWQGLAKITGKGTEKQYKTWREFGYISEPYKPFYTPERAREVLGEEGYQRTVKLWEEYRQDYQKYKDAEENGHNQTAINKANEWNSTIAEDNASYNANLKRYGIITDFVSMATGGRLLAYTSGYYGHKGGYSKEQPVQIETWAEYFSFKMTNDTKGLDIMKKFLPKTYDAFEKKYNALKEK